MAKLKIPTRVANGFDHSTPNERGYVNVVENLILKPQKYLEFLAADEDERADLLQKAAGFEQDGVTPCVIFQELRDDTKVPIDEDNCIIKSEKDKKKRPNSNKPAKFTMPLPDKPPADVDYLHKYAEIIHTLYGQGTAASKKRAHKFMFGMMLLTRCR